MRFSWEMASSSCSVARGSRDLKLGQHNMLHYISNHTPHTPTHITPDWLVAPPGALINEHHTMYLHGWSVTGHVQYK